MTGDSVNGHQATIVGIDSLRKTITVKLNRELSEQQTKRGHTQTVTINVNDLSKGNLTLGYASTTHKAQGQSIPRL